MPACLHARLPADNCTARAGRPSRQARMLMRKPPWGRLMAPIIVDPDKVREFKDAARFYKWLASTTTRGRSLDQDPQGRAPV